MESSALALAATPTTDDAAVQQILATARSGALPQGWYVWHLRRDRVVRAGLGWLFVGLAGTALLIPALIVTVPSNFSSTSGLALFTIALLAVLGAMAVGGLGLFMGETYRYVHSDDYLLVFTPDDFVKATPRRIIHVPMTSIAFVTLKGVRLSQAPTPAESPVTSSALGWGMLFGGSAASRLSPRGAPSLAFLDLRTNTQVVVATDNMFEDLPILEEVLNLYAKGRPTKVPLL